VGCVRFEEEASANGGNRQGGENGMHELELWKEQRPSAAAASRGN
jgi:hypothetical protein